jgi:hypothetical protein
MHRDSKEKLPLSNVTLGGPLWLDGYAPHYTALRSTALRLNTSHYTAQYFTRITLSGFTMDSWLRTTLRCTAVPHYTHTLYPDLNNYTSYINWLSSGYHGCLAFLPRQVGAAPEHRSVGVIAPYCIVLRI